MRRSRGTFFVFEKMSAGDGPDLLSHFDSILIASSLGDPARAPRRCGAMGSAAPPRLWIANRTQSTTVMRPLWPVAGNAASRKRTFRPRVGLIAAEAFFRSRIPRHTSATRKSWPFLSGVPGAPQAAKRAGHLRAKKRYIEIAVPSNSMRRSVCRVP